MAIATDLNTMDYRAEFLRGWPNDGALELSRYKLATGVTVQSGDLVTLNSSAEVIKVAASAASPFAGIVVRGDMDDKSVAKLKEPIILWGKYIVRTQAFSGAVVVGAGVVADDAVFKPAGVNPPMGYVLQVITGTGGQPNSIVVVVA